MPRQSISPSMLPAAEKGCRSKLQQLLTQAEGFLHGSLIVMARRCGKSTCRCAGDDSAKHESLYLGQPLNGRTTMIYIPARLERPVLQWHDNAQQAGRLVEQLSQQRRVRLSQARVAKANRATLRPPARRLPPTHPSNLPNLSQLRRRNLRPARSPTPPSTCCLSSSRGCRQILVATLRDNQPTCSSSRGRC